jgi:hypothetical protein
MRGLLIAAPQAPLSLADAETAQAVYILRGVVTPATLSTAGER